MKRAIVFFAVLFLSGCLGRIYLTDRSKLDFDPATGERHAPTNDPKDKEKIMVWEVETNKPKLAQPKPVDTTETASESAPSTESYQATAVTAPEPTNETSTVPATSGPSDKTYTEYTIQKNDTLQKIAQKFYGTTKKWQMLYNENKDVLKGPNKVYPGLVIKIPNKQ